MSQPSIKITNGAIDAGVLASPPVGTENALIVRTIPSGTQNVSLTSALAAGSNSIGSVGLNAGTNAIGSITNTGFNVTGSLPAGTNAIGSITNTGFAITSAIPTGTNAIGSITNTGFAFGGIVKGTTTANNTTVKPFDANTNALDVTVNGFVNSVLATGANVIGSISNTAFGISGSLPAGTNAIGSITNTGFAITSAIPAGANAIGSITNTGFAITSAIPTGTNAIGSITNTAFTSNIGTTGGLALDATMTGGTARVRMSDGTNFAALRNGPPVSTDYGVVVRSINSDSQVATFSNITTNVTTSVKTNPGSLFRILINGSGDTGNTATLWDGPVGTGVRIATINLASEPTTLNYNLNFATALNVVTAGGVTAGDITVVYA